jgi:hypothetical protein
MAMSLASIRIQEEAFTVEYNYDSIKMKQTYRSRSKVAMIPCYLIILPTMVHRV